MNCFVTQALKWGSVQFSGYPKTRKRLQFIAMQRNDKFRKELMEEISYLPAHMLVWLDEICSDRRSERRKRGYHLRGMTPCAYHLIAREKWMSSIAVMSTWGIENTDGSNNGDTFGDFVDQSLVLILQPFNGTIQDLL